MDTSPDPIDVANHWPFIRRHLLVERWPTMALALDQLAYWQFHAGGNPVRFGTNFWTKQVGLVPGQAGRIRMTFLELEEAGVVSRYPGAGRRANAWTFQSSIGNWRAMPWGGRGRDVERVVEGCICRAARVGIARIPGQRAVLSRGKGEFLLSEADHIRRPGLLLVDTRDADASRAMPTRPPGLLPVDTRDADASPGAHTVLSRELTFSIEGAEQRFAWLTQAISDVCDGQTWRPGRNRPRDRIVALAERLDDSQTAAIIVELGKHRERLFIPRVVEVLEDLATTREVKTARFAHSEQSALPTRIDPEGSVLPLDNYR